MLIGLNICGCLHRRKTMRHVRIIWLLILTLSLFGYGASAQDTSNKWRLEFNGRADAAGEIVIQITVPESQSWRITVEIPKGMSENTIAKLVKNTLKAQLPKDVFKIERDDWEDVLIKKRMGSDNFKVMIIANTAKGVKLDLEKE